MTGSISVRLFLTEGIKMQYCLQSDSKIRRGHTVCPWFMTARVTLEHLQGRS